MTSLRVLRRTGFVVVAGVLVMLAGTRSVAPRELAATAGPARPATCRSTPRRCSRRARSARRSTGCAPSPGPRPSVRRESAARARRRNAPPTSSRSTTTPAAAPAAARPSCAPARTPPRSAERAQMPAGTLPGSAGTWEPVGKGPLIADDPRFDEVNGQGLADLNGRIADFAYDAANDRLFAAVGEGGVWRTDDRGANWRSIGDSLPTQAVGSIAYAGGTLVIVTGDNVFGGGGTFAGLGAFRSTDGGATWQKATGRPERRDRLQGRRRPRRTRTSSTPRPAPGCTARPTAARASSTSTCRRARAPARRRCRRARWPTWSPTSSSKAPDNAATDGTPGAVLAAVGWRAGRKTSQYGYVEAPGNGVYRSDTGAPGTFTGRRRVRADHEPGADRAGRGDRRRAGPPVRLRDGRGRREVQRRSAARRPARPRCAVPDELRRRLRVLGLRGELDADGVRGADGRRRRLRLRAERHRVRDPVLPRASSPGTTSGSRPIPPRTGRAEAPRLRPRGGLGRGIRGRALGGPRASRSSGRTSPASTCMFLTLGQECPTTGSDPTEFNTTTHPDQHAGDVAPAARRRRDARGRQRRRRLLPGRRRQRAPVARRVGPRRQHRLPHAAAVRRPGGQGRHDLRPACRTTAR